MPLTSARIEQPALPQEVIQALLGLKNGDRVRIEATSFFSEEDEEIEAERLEQRTLPTSNTSQQYHNGNGAAPASNSLSQPPPINKPASKPKSIPIYPVDLLSLSEVSPKLRSRIEAISRLRVHRPDLKDGQIAQLIGITQPRLSVIYNLPAYKEAEKYERQKLVVKLDESMGDNIPVLQQVMNNAVPAALQTLLDAARPSNKDLRTRLEASREILDREPRRLFTKKSVTSEAFNSVTLSETIIHSSVKDLKEELGFLNKKAVIDIPSVPLEVI